MNHVLGIPYFELYEKIDVLLLDLTSGQNNLT